MTHFIPVLLAAAEAMDPLQENPLPAPGGSPFFSGQLRDILLVIGAALVMATILFVWAYLTRKDRQRHSASVRGTRLIYRPERGASHSNQGQGRKRIRKRRREHPDNLPRNPTLAEAGGLPPPRPVEPDSEPEETPPPAPAPPRPQTQ